MAKTGPFEEAPERYDEWFEKHGGAYASELAAIRRLMPGGTGLEVGVGSARFAAPLGIKLGVEPSPAMRRLAFRRGVEAVEGSAERLPFMPNWFDFVLMVNVLCFVDDMEEALAEAKRVIKPGGHIVVAFIDRESPLGKAYETKKSESAFYREARFFTPAEMKESLEKAGFADISFVQTIFRDPEEIKEEEPVKDGYGQGSFVVARGRKEKRTTTDQGHPAAFF